MSFVEEPDGVWTITELNPTLSLRHSRLSRRCVGLDFRVIGGSGGRGRLGRIELPIAQESTLKQLKKGRDIPCTNSRTTIFSARLDIGPMEAEGIGVADGLVGVGGKEAGEAEEVSLELGCEAEKDGFEVSERAETEVDGEDAVSLICQDLAYVPSGTPFQWG